LKAAPPDERQDEAVLRERLTVVVRQMAIQAYDSFQDSIEKVVSVFGIVDDVPSARA